MTYEYPNHIINPLTMDKQKGIRSIHKHNEKIMNRKKEERRVQSSGLEPLLSEKAG
jgi:hypothetical protein